ncbi:TrmH family RNA methyltransferase [Algoriphagus namhaensis]
MENFNSGESIRMLSKNTVKFIKSLHQKKYRNQEGLFLVEGEKSVLEVLSSSFQIHLLLGTADFFITHQAALKAYKGEYIEVTQNQLEQVGTFRSNKDALVMAQMGSEEPFGLDQNELAIALDDVKDPGNLGTIIRIADWYGIRKLVLSPQSAEIYNPKVIQATMGSFTRIRWFYEELESVFSRWNRPVYGAFLEGENLHEVTSLKPGVILMGNESKGISPELERCVDRKLTIPAFGQAESLNVAIATAIITDTFKRILSA